MIEEMGSIQFPFVTEPIFQNIMYLNLFRLIKFQVRTTSHFPIFIS